MAAHGAGLEGGEAFGHLGSHGFWGSSVGVDSDFVAGGAAEEFVDGDVEGFAFDVPEGLVNAREGTG